MPSSLGYHYKVVLLFCYDFLDVEYIRMSKKLFYLIVKVSSLPR